ncbi:Eco57I restriction-modification methylase domain-containing protein [Haladaptatus halobius]|uniref:Eco57I restriction-modification methylase domain-containing protein n=1 Tax=Haladaptatus halobius TaxID=2884875 RepID=UPI001D0A66A1|nr:DNA methyltransferase [Haladaptatus halobius]
MGTYNQDFLENRGYFTHRGSDSATVDGKEIEFDFDPDTRLAYFEAVAPDRQAGVVSELRFLGRNFDFYWFWNPDSERVAVYNRYGEHKWFIYNQSIGHSTDVRDSKESKLNRIDEGLETLFDIRDVVDQFYRNLWDIRLDIARAFEVPGETDISDEERLMAAQRTIDRLIFCYFLVEKDIIHGIDDAGNRLQLSPGELFKSVLDDDEFYTFLMETFFDHLNTSGWTEYEVTDTVSIAYPYLNGGLFRNHRIPTEDGDELQERELDGTAYNWSALIDELNKYNWLVEQSPPDETEADSPNKLSPAVLGHIFEKFVITVSELSDDELLSLAELDEMDVSASGEQMLKGNRKVGAYYTPNYIAYENTRETLWNRVRAVLTNKHNISPEQIPSADQFFKEVYADDSSIPVERNQLEEVLTDITVLDPAAGSGAFLMACGEILETWRHQATTEKSRYELRREIIRKSLYGVDLLDGAVEVCKLRLWLWLISATSVDLSQGEPEIETLPNIDFNIRQGNSLVGIVRPAYDSLIVQFEFEWTDGEQKKYPEAVNDYRENILEYQTASGETADELLEELTTQRQILQKEFTDILAQQSDVIVEEDIGSYQEFTDIIDDVTGRIKCNLDFDSAMTDDVRHQVSDAGFREQVNWPTTAYHQDIRQANAESVTRIFELMEDQGTISVERPISPSDIEDLDPFHWIFEFPMAFAPTNESGEMFDVVIGNPPHGSSPGSLEKSLLEKRYSLIEGSREVAKMFLERSWELTGGELSYIVPKPSTYNSNWEDFRAFCLDKLYRGVDLGKAFRNVDHEQVTVHLSQTVTNDHYDCGQLPDGAYHLDDTAAVSRSFAETLGTLPVSFSAKHQTVAAGLAAADFPTMGEIGVDAGRGASTTNRITDNSAPIGYNGKQVQRYFTRAPEHHIKADNISNATRQRVETPKVMAQNILAHKKNPYDHLLIAAVYDPVETYNFETVTNIVVPDDANLSLPALAVLLNTQFVNWFVYFSIFNRAIRDMHFDAYFLDNLVLPGDLSEVDQSVLEDLYGLLAITGVAMEYDSLPSAQEPYAEFQSMANALTYELYLRNVAEQPLETDLVELISTVLDDHDINFIEWYCDHLKSANEQEIIDAFCEREGLFATATDVVESLQSGVIVRELEKIADHPWVEIIERGQQWRDDRPFFGPFEGT